MCSLHGGIKYCVAFCTASLLLAAIIEFINCLNGARYMVREGVGNIPAILNAANDIQKLPA